MRKRNGDVAWFLPNKKKPFAYSTISTSDSIALLYEIYGDLRLVYDNVKYDKEVKEIVKFYIDNGVYQINIKY